MANVAISDVDALMYVVLSKAEKHVPNGALVGTTVAEVSHKPMSLQPNFSVVTSRFEGVLIFGMPTVHF